jgi:hypothetical protein
MAPGVERAALPHHLADGGLVLRQDRLLVHLKGGFVADRQEAFVELGALLGIAKGRVDRVEQVEALGAELVLGMEGLELGCRGAEVLVAGIAGL